MLPKLFQKRVENFSCKHCRALVQGNGYTNHCPQCLWSLHVDVYPGDRVAKCGGLMEPASAFLEKGEWRIIHRCVACGYEKKNRLAPDDSMDALLAIFRG